MARRAQSSMWYCCCISVNVLIASFDCILDTAKRDMESRAEYQSSGSRGLVY